jgi:hypothetical protein
VYRAFQIPLNLKKNEAYETHLNEGKALKASSEMWLLKTLKPYLKKDGVLNGTLLQKTWFPAVSADVFISHSHADENDALVLAAFLKRMGVEPFIDSAAWGYSADLLKIIDEHGSKKTDGNYDYERRNGTTGHVHMMLATALARMIDCCETVFFVNTPNSISAGEASDSTKSPWIFYEIATMSWIRPLSPWDHRRIKIAKSDGVLTEEKQYNFSVDYDVDLRNLAKVGWDTILEWKEEAKATNPSFPLDLLYKKVPPISHQVTL